MAAGWNLDSHRPLPRLYAIGRLANRRQRTLRAIVHQSQRPLTRSRQNQFAAHLLGQGRLKMEAAWLLLPEWPQILD